LDWKERQVVTGASGTRHETVRKRSRFACVLTFLAASLAVSESYAQASLAEAFSKTLTSKTEPESGAKPKANEKPKSKTKPRAKSKASGKSTKATAKEPPAKPEPTSSPVETRPRAPVAAVPLPAGPPSVAPPPEAPPAPTVSAVPAEVVAASPLPPAVEAAPVALQPATTEPAADPATAPALLSPLRLAMFVDAYVAVQTNAGGTLATLSGHRAYSGQGSTFLSENGFSLAFLGFDASYETTHFGATANLRFGEAAPLYHAHAEPESDFTFGIDLLTQAYLTWRPKGPLVLDLGMFSTPFGAEVLESWRNLNYTRGALYYYAQPAWHTGLRVQYDFAEEFGVTGFVANGSNNISETQAGFGLDQTPTFGVQLRVTPQGPLSFALGGLFTLDGYNNDDAGFDGFGDFVATLELGGLHGVFNADYILTREGAPDENDRQFFGFSIGLGYDLSEHFALAARGEYLLDDANFDGDTDQWRLLTATLTADYKPLSDTPNLIIRWDNRWEQSNQAIFGANSQATADTADDTYRTVWFESVLGVVVTSAP
jgi:hypothetical protein